MRWPNFAAEFAQAAAKAGYISLNNREEVEVKLTNDEMKVVRTAVLGSIDLYNGYVKIPYDEDDKMKRKKIRLRKALVHLRSALQKLK